MATGSRRGGGCLLAGALGVLLGLTPGWAQTPPRPSRGAPQPALPAAGPSLPRAQLAGVTPMPLSMNVGTGHVVSLAQPASSLFVADPKVAEVRPAGPTSLFIFGIAPGRTSIAAIGEGGAPVAQIELTVRPSAFGASEIVGGGRGGPSFPGVSIQPTPGGYLVTGHVATPAEAERALSAVRPYLTQGQSIENRLSVDTPLTVNLRVRIVEVQRSVTRQIGINWSALMNQGLNRFAIGFSMLDRLSSPTNLPDAINVGYNAAHGGINAVIDALAQDQLATILAEPNLTAQSGETASFLAGGEYPIPIAQQNNTISVEYKQYGVSLAFVPTVLSADRISLKVRPEVSELTDQGAVSISNGALTLSVPALTVRRAETTVELGSGQSFAIAGLLSDTSTQTARGLPVLGEMPVLGALFKSTKFQRGETELVILVTPYLVRGVRAPAALDVPTRELVLAGDLDRILFNRQRARGTTQVPAARIPLDAGFIAP